MPSSRSPARSCSSAWRRRVSTPTRPRAGCRWRARRALAADSLQLAEKSFALGEADLATLLRLRAGAYEAEAFLNRDTVAHAAAESRLKQALGVLP